MRPYRNNLIGANIIALLAVICAVPIPLLMPLLVDEVLLQQPAELVALCRGLFPAAWQGPVLYISVILGLTIILRMLALVLNVWQTRHFTLVAKDITFKVRQRILNHLRIVSMAEYETLGSGTVGSHLVTDINAIDEFIGSTISKAVVSLLTLIGITAVLLLMHWQLALFILVMNPAVIFFTMVLGKKVKKLKRRENKAFEVFQQTLGETLEGIRQLRANRREKIYLDKTVQQADGIRRAAAQFAWKSDAANRFSMGVFLFGFDSFRAISMLMVVFSDLSIGEMMAVFGYLWFMMSPVQELLNIHYGLFSATAAMDRLNALLTLETEPQYACRNNPFQDKLTVGIRLENIRFRYGRGPWVLNGVNIDIKAGEKVAFVGASGGGKSTLVQVILGMYSANEGMVYFDDVPVTDIGYGVVREHVATVLQHPALFNQTVRQNLGLGHQIEERRLWRALQIAQLDELVQSWPKQLDTLIGNQGVKLSGGQRQRLAIARMVLADPKVVLLDEATSALDTHTEARVLQELSRYLADKTTIIIAHRLSAVKQADRVYVFEDGNIAEHGEHDQLIKQNGLYQKLYGKLQ